MRRFVVPFVALLALVPLRAEPKPVETGAFAFELEARVPVPPARAFDAFTRETLAWWDHHFSEHPKSLSFDARPGGGFVEVFDEAGNGAWHATVIYALRPRSLRFEGPLGLSGHAIDAVYSMAFEPVEGGTRVTLSARAAGEYDKSWPAAIEGVWRHFLVERFVPYVTAHRDGPVSGTPESADPLAATVLRYREAKKRNDLDAQRALLAAKARMWFETKAGPGLPLEVGSGGGDPWSDWDRYFRSASTVEEVSVEGRTVRLTVSEINDWYRLVDRAASRYLMSYELDADGKIAAVLVHGIPGEPKRPDRLAEFERWATAARPGLMARLEPEGKLDPALAKAKLWKASLFEWRKAAGLGVPDGVESAGETTPDP